MMFTQFLQKINLKRSLFACLLWSLLAFSLQANLTLKEILKEDDDDGDILYNIDKANSLDSLNFLGSEYIFDTQESSSNNSEFVFMKKNISLLSKVVQQVLGAIKKCTLEEIRASKQGLRVLLAQLFVLKDYDMKDYDMRKSFYNLIIELKNKKEKDSNKTGLDAIFYEKTGKSRSFLCCLLKNGYKQRWEEEMKFIQGNSELKKSKEWWKEWWKEKANKLVTDLKELFKDMQPIGKFPRIEIDALLQTTDLDDSLFKYFLDKGNKQHKDEQLYWLNEKYLLKGSYSSTFLYEFLNTVKKNGETKKKYIFNLIKEDNKLGIDILQQNDNIGKKKSPTAFVEACLYNQKDAIFLLEKIKETYKNNKEKEKEAIEYLNSTRENGRKNQDALMAALYVSKKEFKNELINALLNVKGIIVTQNHIEYLEKEHQSKNDKYQELHSKMQEIHKLVKKELEMKEKVRKKLDKIYQKKVSEKDNEIKNLKQQQQSHINKLENKINKLKNEHQNKINKINNEHQNKINKINNEHKNEINKINNEHKNEINKLKNEISKLKNEHQNKIKSLKNEINNLSNEHENKIKSIHNKHKTELENEKSNYAKLLKTIEGDGNVSSELKKQIEEKNNQISELKDKLNTAKQEKDSFENKHKKTNLEKKELEDKLKQASDNFTNHKKELEDKVQKANKKAEDLDDELQKANKKANDLDDKLQKANEGKNKIEIQLKKLKDQNSNLGSSTEVEKEINKKEIEKLKKQLDEKDKQITELKSKNSKPGSPTQEISHLTNKLNKKRNKIDQLTQKVKEFEKKNLNKTDSKQIELSNQLEDSKTSNQLLKEKLKDNQEKSKDLQKKLDKRNQKVTQITEEINQLKKNKFSSHFALKVYSGIISLVLIAAGILGVWYRNMMKKQLEEATK